MIKAHMRTFRHTLETDTPPHITYMFDFNLIISMLSYFHQSNGRQTREVKWRERNHLARVAVVGGAAALEFIAAAVS